MQKFENFTLRKERNGLNAAIVLDCIANSLTMVTSIFFIDQLTPFCMYVKQTKIYLADAACVLAVAFLHPRIAFCMRCSLYVHGKLTVK